ncbi:MAG: hypothetical protein HQK66_00905 [Desulfamplus sp.]|nr:hypothetical protein [Desulfamplus sp.]
MFYLVNKKLIIFSMLFFCLTATSLFAAPPTLVIRSPADNSTVSYRSTIVFLADANDQEDGILTGQSIIWLSNNDGFLGYGISFTNSRLSVGTHTVTATARDSDGEETSASITVTVSNEAPEVLITSPQDNSTRPQGAIITFLANAKDPEEGVLTGQSVIWESDRDGFLGYGISFTKSNLTVGTHVITATATDGFGKTGSDSITVIIGNASPKVLITSPADNSSHPKGLTLVFLASATDPEDGVLTGQSVVWKSDRDGFLGYGTSVTTDRLSLGTHVVTVTVRDSTGLEGSSSITVTVGNASPEILIRLPADNSSFSQGEMILFVANVTDREDGNLSGESVRWVSDRDGFFGFGTSFSINALSVGTHVITVTAKDSDGLDSSSSITVAVGNESPVIVITHPPLGSSFDYGEEVSFSADINDREDGPLGGKNVIWMSDQDGFLGYDSSFTISTLSLGTHVVTVTATDSFGAEASSTLTIAINEKEPAGIAGVSILKPQDGDTFFLNDYIEFQGEVTADEDGGLYDGTLVWTSNIEDDPLGQGELFRINTLTAGKHLVTLTATDNLGGSVRDFILITVANSLPEPWISFPITGSVFEDTDEIRFKGGASDPEDGELTSSSLSWVSDIDGYLGSGREAGITLSPGEHTVTLIARDRHGDESSVSVTVTINATSQSRPMTLENSRISLFLGQDASLAVSGGHPPYRYYREYPHIASMDIYGDEIILRPESLGETTFKIVDRQNTTLTLGVTVMDSMENFPFAHAGPDGSVTSGTTVILDGRESEPGIHGIASWQWKQLNEDNSARVVLSDTDTPRVTFVAPGVSEESWFTFRLTITDNTGNVSSDDAVITVLPNGIEGYPHGVVSFMTVDGVEPLGLALAGEGDFVAIVPGYEQFVTDGRGRPENMIYGLVDIGIKVDEGAGAHMILYLPRPLEEGYGIYKYSPVHGWYEYFNYVTFSADRTRAYIVLRDGGPGDDDGMADGIITDPLTIGTPPSTPLPPPEEPGEPPASGGDDGGGGGCFISTLI